VVAAVAVAAAAAPGPAAGAAVGGRGVAVAGAVAGGGAGGGGGLGGGPGMSDRAEPDSRSWASGIEPVWCPGCGDYAVLKALGAALVRTGARPEDVCWVSGIGCACRLPCFLKGYAFHGVHGRALPMATGIRISRPTLRVIVTMGDGDALSIGAGHFLHACRRNPGVTCLVLDNGLFGMTKGQPSPTAPPGAASRATPGGGAGAPLDPVALAVVSGATFAGRAAATDAGGMSGLFDAALAHRGFALLHVLSPCVTFGGPEPHAALRASVRPLAETSGLGDRGAAVATALARDPVRTGLFWREDRPVLEETAAAPAHAGSPSFWEATVARYA